MFYLDFQNFRNGWKKVALVYSSNGHRSWSGENSCWAFMATIVKVAKEENIQLDEIKLDSTDKLYPNDTAKMLHEQKSLFNEFGGRPSLIFNISLFVGYEVFVIRVHMDYSITGHGTPIILILEVGIPGPKL